MSSGSFFPRLLNSVRYAQDASLFRNIGWLSSGMLINRVLRLVITVVLARSFGPEEYGLMALIFTAHEIVSLFIHRCTNVKIIQAPATALNALCATTFSINWVLGGVLLLSQCLLALFLSELYSVQALILPLCVLALVHIQLPLAMVQSALNVRAGKMRLVAQIEVAQTLVEAVFVLTLLYSGAGIWSVVIPKLLTPVIWIVVHRRHSEWRARQWGVFNKWREVVSYSGNLLVVDGLQVIRQNADYLLIGYMLGIEALGLYFFAYNAGLGIATGFTNAFTVAMLPHFCESSASITQLQARFRRSLLLIAVCIGALVLVQTIFAGFYVPWVFGQDWVDRGAVALIILLCLVALPKAIIDACSQYLRACDDPRGDLNLQALFSVSLVIAIAVAAFWGLTAIAMATLLVYSLSALVSLYYCFTESRQLQGEPSYSIVPSKDPSMVRIQQVR